MANEEFKARRARAQEDARWNYENRKAIADKTAKPRFISSRDKDYSVRQIEKGYRKLPKYGKEVDHKTGKFEPIPGSERWYGPSPEGLDSDAQKEWEEKNLPWKPVYNPFDDSLVNPRKPGQANLMTPRQNNAPLSWPGVGKSSILGDQALAGNLPTILNERTGGSVQDLFEERET